MGLVDRIKEDAKKAGQNKGKFVYVRENQKLRVRFLTDMDDGLELTFHDSFDAGVNVPCQDHYDKDCPYCEQEGLRTRSQYVWSVYNYEAKEVQLFMFPVNNCSPIPSLIAMHENYGTITDRDYVITVQGKQANKQYTVIPMDKVKFRNEKAKAFSGKAILKMVAKAYPADDVDDEDDDDYEEDKKSKKSKAANAKSNKAVEDDDEEYEDYSDMSAKELYKLCKERDIDVQPKKSEKYYIKQLEEYDKSQEEWGGEEEEDDEEEWEEDDE